MRKVILSIIILMFLYGCKNNSQEIEIADELIVVKQKYGNDPTNEIELAFHKVSKSEPTVLFLHGGGWFDQSYKIWINASKRSFFFSNGMNLASIDYRLSPNPIDLNNPNRIKHPDHIRDAAKSIRWLVDNADLYGIDISKIFVMGHSAGAQMACLIGTNGKYLNEVGLDLSIIKGIISLDGGAYLTKDIEMMKNNPISNELTFWDIYRNAFTDQEEVQNDATPLFFIKPNKDLPPVLLVSQGIDQPFRYIPNKQLYDRLTEYGVETTLFIADKYEHSVIFNCIGNGADGIGIGKTIVEFIKKNQ